MTSQVAKVTAEGYWWDLIKEGESVKGLMHVHSHKHMEGHTPLG